MTWQSIIRPRRATLRKGPQGWCKETWSGSSAETAKLSQDKGKRGSNNITTQRRHPNVRIRNNPQHLTARATYIRNTVDTVRRITLVASSVFVYIVAGSTEFDTLRRNSVDSSGCADRQKSFDRKEQKHGSARVAVIQKALAHRTDHDLSVYSRSSIP